MSGTDGTTQVARSAAKKGLIRFIDASEWSSPSILAASLGVTPTARPEILFQGSPWLFNNAKYNDFVMRQGFMHAAKVVVHHVERDGRAMV
jgi:hypothetical protein